MKWFAELRLLALVRRGVRALESIADSHRVLADIATRTWDETHRHPDGPRKKSVLGQMDQREVNRRWRAAQREMGIEVVEIDEDEVPL